MTRLTFEIKNGFKIRIPDFALLCPKGEVIILDHNSKAVLTALLINEFVIDADLKQIAKSYPSVVHKLRKLSNNYMFTIKRLRNTGYTLRWRSM